MTRLTILTISSALFLAACAASPVPEAPADEDHASQASLTVGNGAPSQPRMEIAASGSTQKNFSITRWQVQPLQKTLSIIGLNVTNETVFEFKLESSGERGVQVVGRDAMTRRQTEIADAYLSDLVRDSQLHATDDELISKSGGPGCQPCGSGPESFKCYVAGLVCQDKQMCPDSNDLTGWSAKSCGSPYPCGLCLGFDW